MIKKMIANAQGVIKRQIWIRSADQKIKKDCKCTRCRKRNLMCKLDSLIFIFKYLYISSLTTIRRRHGSIG